MAKGINYGELTSKAIRQVLAEVLSQIARDGLPGKHHLFIAFDTTHPGVDMDAGLRARYPQEMTIVLQDWFSDLAVMKDRFTVTLNFGNVPESIVVPFEAIKTFADPSVNFGYHFKAQEPGEIGPADQIDSAEAEADQAGEAEVVSLDKFRKH